MSQEQSQAAPTRNQSIIDSFFKKFSFSELLRKANIRKTKGAPPLTIFNLIFSLAFSGKNFYQGVVQNSESPAGKDAVYNFLNNPRFNWRRLGLLLAAKMFVCIRNLIDKPEDEEVLIFDDSPYERGRSKKVELLSRVFDHTFRKYIKGFRLLTLGWSDGNTFLGLDFVLLSSADIKNRYQEIIKSLDKRTCGYKRRIEAVVKSTELLEPMLKRALSFGIKAKYVLMDSWFSAPCVISTLRKHIHVICMLKDQPTWLYIYQGKKMRLSELYRKLKKRRGKSKVKASVIVESAKGEKVKIIFVPSDKKRGWLALLTTDIFMLDEEVIRLYGKRWDIEVYFKVAKQHLKLVKEIQLRDYDGLIAHTTIVMMRYNFLAYCQREAVDHRTCGELFRTCCQELENLRFIEALQRIMAIATEVVRKSHSLAEETIRALIDAVMGEAIRFFNLDDRQSPLIS